MKKYLLICFFAPWAFMSAQTSQEKQLVFLGYHVISDTLAPVAQGVTSYNQLMAGTLDSTVVSVPQDQVWVIVEARAVFLRTQQNAEALYNQRFPKTNAMWVDGHRILSYDQLLLDGRKAYFSGQSTGIYNAPYNPNINGFSSASMVNREVDFRMFYGPHVFFTKFSFTSTGSYASSAVYAPTLIRKIVIEKYLIQ